MIDEEGDVLKTFTDYVDEKPINYIEFTVTEGHGFDQKPIRDIVLPPDTLIVNIKRDNANVIPRGDTILKKGDSVLLCALENKKNTELALYEKIIDEDSLLIGSQLKDIGKYTSGLVVLIQRGDGYIIPDGNVVLKANDRVVINHDV